MTERIGRAVLELSTDAGAFNKGLDQAEARLQTLPARFDTIGKQLQSVGGGLTKYVTLPLTAIGAGLVAVGTQFDGALHTIRAGTGATGEDLSALGESFRRVWASGAEGADVVASALADLSTRTGLTGEPLEHLTRQMLNLADVAKTDVGPLIASTTRLFGDWSVATEHQGGALDFLWKTSQSTGIGVDALAQKLVQFGAPLRQMGFGLEESAALLGKWEKEGVNAELVLGSLRIGVANLAKQGVSAAEMGDVFRQRLDAIKTSADPVSAAIKLFGTRAGPDMAAAITEGRFAVDELLASLQASGETINQADADTEDLAEKFGTLKNNVSSALAPVGIQLVEALERLLPKITWLAEKIAAAAEWFSKLPAPVQGTALALAGIAAVVGPVLMGVGSLLTTLAAIAPWFAAGTTGATLLGGALAVLTGPIGIAAAAIAGLAFVWVKWGDDIKRIVGDTYQAVKTWLVDKFQDIVTGIKGKLDAVTGFFRGMFDVVVGHSIVPDMAKQVAAWFDKMGVAMADRTKKATAAVIANIDSLARQWGNTLEEMRIAEIAAQQAHLRELAEKDRVGMQLLFDERARQAEEALEAADAIAKLDLQRELEKYQQQQQWERDHWTVISEIRNAAGLALMEQDAARMQSSLAATVKGLFTDLPKAIMGAIQGGGDVGGAIGGSIFANLFDAESPLVQGLTKHLTGGLGKTIGGAIGSLIPGIGTLLGTMAGDLIGPLISKVGGFFKTLFGGVSEVEKQGRASAAAFRMDLESMLTSTQRVEAGNEKWKQSVIVVRDAYLAAGRTAEEGLAAHQRLWEAEKRGGDAVRQVIEDIEAVMRQGLTPAAQEFGDTFSDAAVRATDDLTVLGGVVAQVKEDLAAPVTIPIMADYRGAFFRNATSSADSGGSIDFINYTDEDMADWLRRNQGDAHRMDEALDLSLVADLTRAGISEEVAKAFLADNGGDKARMREAFDLPQLAAGGLVTRPLIGQIGEAGPEVIYPLDRFEQMWARRGESEQPILVRLEVDGITLAERMVRHMPRALSHAGLA